MFRKIRISLVAILITGALAAQTSGIKVHVFDKATGQALPFANVVVEQGTKQIAGAMTDDNGYAELKPLDPGTYDVLAVNFSYHDQRVQGVIVTQDILVKVEVPMVSVADTSIKVTIIQYRTPLIMQGTEIGGVADSADIHSRAAESIDAIAASVPGVYSSDVGASLNIGGNRTGGTEYIIDGRKVTADQARGAIPNSLIDQETVITGGVPAKYGDATGGIVEINTLSGANHFFGSVQGYTSNIFDSYDNNDLGWSVGGPLWSKKDSNKRKNTIVDFIFGGEYIYEKDNSPNFGGATYANSSTLAALNANPITPEPGGIGFYSSADYVMANQLETQSWHQNSALDEISLSGKLNFYVSNNVKVTVGGSYQYITEQEPIYGLQLYDPEANPQYNQTNYNGFVRLTQKFYTPETKGKTSLIKNAFYSVQAEYSHTYEVTESSNFGNNYFNYGYIGQFYQYRVPTYAFNENGSRGPGNYMTAYNDSAYTFKPSNLNPIEVNYTNDVIKQLGTAGEYSTVIPSNNGFINGSNPFANPVYSLWYNVGASYPSYTEQNANHFRFSADFSAEIANNSIEVGFEYEQNSLSYFSLSASELWGLMRQLSNEQLTALDTANPILVNSGTNNTYNYNYLNNASQQSQFDKSLRQKLGLPVNGTQWIQPDNYSPSIYSLNMFSAGELLNSGSSYVNYYGYNYTGNLNSSNPSIDDFFNARDANGNLLYPMPAYRPIYMAGYIQDHFDIKTMVFDVGLRVEQFNANQYQLKDPYLLFPAKTAGEVGNSLGTIPSNIGNNYVVYVNNVQNPSSIVGYRNGNNWYDASGNLVSDPTVIQSLSSGNTIQPYLENRSLVNSSQIGSNAFTTYTPQTEVLPRLAFSFPITDKADFFAHYDILTERPLGIGYNIFIPTQYLYIASQNSNGTILSNPALGDQKTINYELGFTQVLNEAKSMAITISASYRNIDGEVQSYRFLDAFPTTYIAYVNEDFGTTKGLSISYDLRRIGNWSDVKFQAGYSLMFADGTGSGPASGFNLVNSGEPNLQIPERLDIDQRHTFNADLDFHFSSGSNYDGPVWTTHSGKSVQILSNAGINISFYAGSGTPYTQWTNPTQQGIGLVGKYGLTGSINGDNLPWQNRIDVKADKSFRLTIKSHPCQLQVYISATNLFNTENILAVYNYTGSPTDDGYLESTAGKQTIAGQVSPQAFIDQYTVKEKTPTAFSLPRLMKLGVVFNF